jgi:hypothetical protein
MFLPVQQYGLAKLCMASSQCVVQAGACYSTACQVCCYKVQPLALFVQLNLLYVTMPAGVHAAMLLLHLLCNFALLPTLKRYL